MTVSKVGILYHVLAKNDILGSCKGLMAYRVL